MSCESWPDGIMSRVPCGVFWICTVIGCDDDDDVDVPLLEALLVVLTVPLDDVINREDAIVAATQAESTKSNKSDDNRLQRKRD